MALWDKLKTELDRAGRAAQTAFDEGKVRLELLRLRQLADKAAQALGYAVHNARRNGGDLDAESYSRLSSTLAAHEAEIARLEAQLAAEQAATSEPRPATAEAKIHDEPPSSGASGTTGTSTGSSGTESSTGPGGGTPPFSRPVSPDPRGVDPAMGDTGGTSGQGGPSQPPGF